MAGTKSGGLKARETNYQNHGKDFYREIGRKGGLKGHTGGFASNPELAKIAGAKGGRKSSKGKVTMRITIKLTEEQLNQLIHYRETKSIVTACNLVNSLVEQLEVK